MGAFSVRSGTGRLRRCALALVAAAAAVAAVARGASAQASPADVHFMTGMIHHHAQAVLMARWAPTHGASDALQRLAERILVGQRDEIVLMRGWLGDKGATVPEPTPGPMRMKQDGMDHEMLMPGMLTDAQLAVLDSARGEAFDGLFLTLMIQHHAGAIEMVRTLFASPGAGQDPLVFRFASDVAADQAAEIARMRALLGARRPRSAPGGPERDGRG